LRRLIGLATGMQATGNAYIAIVLGLFLSPMLRFSTAPSQITTLKDVLDRMLVLCPGVLRCLVGLATGNRAPGNAYVVLHLFHHPCFASVSFNRSPSLKGMRSLVDKRRISASLIVCPSYVEGSSVVLSGGLQEIGMQDQCIPDCMPVLHRGL
jgi:hypothetical protein